MPKVIPHVLAQHAEEAAFLWLLRDDAASRQPHYYLGDLAELDARVDAHLEGLRIAGAEGWAMCKSELKWREPGEVFAAAVLALQQEDTTDIDEVVSIGSADEELQRGLISALGWSASAQVVPLLERLITAAEPSARAVGVAGYAVRRQDPKQHWPNLLSDGDPLVRCRAVRAAAQLGRADLVPAIRQSLSDENPACRYWAAWSAGRLGDRSASLTTVLRQSASEPGPLQDIAMRSAARMLPSGEVRQWLVELADDTAMQRAAAIGMGALGDPALIGSILTLASSMPVAREAGEAFSTITGIDLAYDNLEQDEPAEFTAGPTDNPADEHVAMDPDENLPWPNVDLLRTWWEEHRQAYLDGHRYLRGREISSSSLPLTMSDGYQRQRAAAALELALLEPSRAMFEVRARGDWQQQLLPQWYPSS